MSRSMMAPAVTAARPARPPCAAIPREAPADAADNLGAGIGDVEGVNDGLEAAYYTYRADLFRLICARLGDASEAEDILQDLWLKARDQHAVSNGRAYLYRMAQNLVIDRVRERTRRMYRDYLWVTDYAIAGTQMWERSAEELAHEHDEAERLSRAIEKLPQGARAVFQLHKLEGLSHAEIASRLAITRSGVEKHMAVAMKHLRRALLN